MTKARWKIKQCSLCVRLMLYKQYVSLPPSYHVWVQNELIITSERIMALKTWIKLENSPFVIYAEVILYAKLQNMWCLMHVIQFKSCIHLISPCTMDAFVIIHTQKLVNITTRVPNYKNTKWPIVALWCTTLLMWLYEDLLLVRCELKKVQFAGCVYTKTYYDSGYNWVTIWPTFRKPRGLNDTDQSKQITQCKIWNVIIHF